MRIGLLIEVSVLMILGLLSIIDGIRVTFAEKIQISDVLGPGLYNVGLGFTLIILAFIYFISQRRKILEKRRESVARETREYEIMMISMIVIMVLYIFFIDLIGYLLASVVFFLLINRAVGVRSWLTNLIATTIMAISFYVIFVVWMGMIFPRGGLLNF
jgi:putative tricarboxylic transport membrane protein